MLPRYPTTHRSRCRSSRRKDLSIKACHLRNPLWRQGLCFVKRYWGQGRIASIRPRANSPVDVDRPEVDRIEISKIDRPDVDAEAVAVHAQAAETGLDVN